MEYCLKDISYFYRPAVLMSLVNKNLMRLMRMQSIQMYAWSCNDYNVIVTATQKRKSRRANIENCMGTRLETMVPYIFDSGKNLK